MTAMPMATLSQLVKLASAVRHFQEHASDGGVPVDLETADALMADPDVVRLMDDLDAAGLLPVKR